MIKIAKKRMHTIVLTFFLAGFSFYLALTLQKTLFGSFSTETSLFSVYLPAGVTFIALLLGGVFAAIGIFFVLLINYLLNFPDVSWSLAVALIGFSLSIQLIVVNSFLYLARVGTNLEKLKHLHIVGLAIIFSISHSLCHHLNLVKIAKFSQGWAESMIALSTFWGVFTFLFLLWCFSKVRNYLSENVKSSTF
jgi:hypothetical protein